MRLKVKVLVTQSCPTLRDPINCSPPGSSVHGIFQARILESLPCPPSGDLPKPGIEPSSPALHADSLPSWATREPTLPCSDCRWSCWGYCCFLSSLYFCVCLNKCQKKLLGNLKNNLGAFKAFPVISQSVRSHKRKDWASPLDINFF